MFTRKIQNTRRPSKKYQHINSRNDQLPFLSRARFTALPGVHSVQTEPEKLSLLMASLYVIDLFGVFPFIILPAHLVDLGLLGIPLVISVIILQIYTSFLLSRCWTMAEILDPSMIEKHSYPYVAIAELAYGKYVSFFVALLLDISIFANGIPNIVMASENVELVALSITNGQFAISFCYYIFIIGLFLCPIMAITNPQKMRVLAIISVSIVIIIIILLLDCLYSSDKTGLPFHGITADLPEFVKILNGYCILAFQFDIHPMLLTMQIDMHKSQKSKSWIAVIIGITCTCTFVILCFVIALYKFGIKIPENILEILPKNTTKLIILIFVSVQLCCSSTVGSSAMFLQIEHFFKISDGNVLKRIVLRYFIVALQVTVAEFIPDFDTFINLVGGSITAPLIYIFPSLFYRRIRKLLYAYQKVVLETSYGSMSTTLNYKSNILPYNISHKLQTSLLPLILEVKREITLPMTITVIGTLATCTATYLNIFKITNLFRNNSPCFMNLTSGS